MKVKICGLTSVDDALAAAEAGADWLGLNFHPPSPRYVEEDIAREIVRAVGMRVECVGLFVNRQPAEILAIARRVGLSIIQLHGSEPVEDLAELGGLGVVRAFRIADVQNLDKMRAYPQRAAESGHPLRAVLVDAFVPGQFGGTGQSIDEDLLPSLAHILPDLPPLILAGGLTPENVADRIARVMPWMVDVAGGVELSPGRKDPAKMAAFVRMARSN